MITNECFGCFYCSLFVVKGKKSTREVWDSDLVKGKKRGENQPIWNLGFQELI